MLARFRRPVWGDWGPIKTVSLPPDYETYIISEEVWRSLDITKAQLSTYSIGWPRQAEEKTAMRKATVEQPAAKPGQSKPCRHPAKSVAQWRKSWPNSLCAALPPSQPKTWALTTQPACGNGIRNAEPCPGQHAAPTRHRRHNSAVPRQRSRRHGRRESECRLQPLHRRAAAGMHTASGRAGWKTPRPRRASGAGSRNNTADANGQGDSNRGQTKGAADFRSAVESRRHPAEPANTPATDNGAHVTASVARERIHRKRQSYTGSRTRQPQPHRPS